jgi:two-component system, chemotaxis family, sensor kinase CheA
MPRTNRPGSRAVDLSRFLPMFFQETEEHLAIMEGHLLRLDWHSPDAEALNSVFRAAHSVKGNSTIFGATRLADVMHRIETILDHIRKQELQPTHNVISLLLEACDTVREELRGLKDSADTDPAALQAVYERLTQLAQSDAAPSAAPLEAAPRRSARFRIEVHLPEGQDITALPLAQLYAELGTLGRVEDVHASGGASGVPALSLFLLTPERQQLVRAKLVSLLGADNVHVKQQDAAPRPSLPTGCALPAHATGTANTAYGLFTPQRSSGGTYDRSGSVTQTGAFDSSALGRRSMDLDPGRSGFGRRATDRAHFDRSSIRVDVAKVDRLLNLVGELVIAQSMLTEASQRSGAAQDTGLRDSIAYVARQTRDLQEAVMGIRLLPLDFLFSRVPRLVRDLAHKLNKDVELIMHGGDAELDKELIEKLADPLMHLVRNSLDHGIEPPALREAAGKSRRGSVQLRAVHQGGGILVEVQDDGAGFDREKILRKAEERGLHVHAGMSDEEVWQLVFVPGFTTVDEVSDVSGRGVGLDVVKRNINALSGHVDVRSSRGRGATIAMRLPLTLAILEGMTVEIGGESFIVPLSFISEALLPTPGQIKTIASGPQVVQVRDSYVPLLDLEPLLHIRRETVRKEQVIAIVIEADGRRAALAVERLLGQQQVVIKSLEANYRRIPGIAGATVLGNGRVALILDVNALMRVGLAPMKGMETLDTIHG